MALTFTLRSRSHFELIFLSGVRLGLRFMFFQIAIQLGFPVVRLVTNLPANAGDARDKGLILGWGRSLE